MNEPSPPLHCMVILVFVVILWQWEERGGDSVCPFAQTSSPTFLISCFPTSFSTGGEWVYSGGRWLWNSDLRCPACVRTSPYIFFRLVQILDIGALTSLGSLHPSAFLPVKWGTPQVSVQEASTCANSEPFSLVDGNINCPAPISGGLKQRK